MRTPVTSGNPLTRRWLLNLALLVVVAALGLYAWYRSGEEPVETRPLLTNIDGAAVQTIEIIRAEESPVRLKRDAAQWRLTAPLKARADSFAVDTLLRLLRAPAESITTPADGDLARYGFDRPRLTVRFGKEAVRFGEGHPFKDEHYVQYDGRVYLIANRYYAQAAAPPTNLIDSRLIEPGRKLTELQLPDFRLTLKDGEWRRDPAIESLSSDRINGFVDDWRHARALQVEKYAGKPAAEQVRLVTENADGSSSELTLGILARTPELVLHRPDEGLEYRFPGDTAQRLLGLGE